MHRGALWFAGLFRPSKSVGVGVVALPWVAPTGWLKAPAFVDRYLIQFGLVIDSRKSTNFEDSDVFNSDYDG